MDNNLDELCKMVKDANPKNLWNVYKFNILQCINKFIQFIEVQKCDFSWSWIMLVNLGAYKYFILPMRVLNWDFDKF